MKFSIISFIALSSLTFGHSADEDKPEKRIVVRQPKNVSGVHGGGQEYDHEQKRLRGISHPNSTKAQNAQDQYSRRAQSDPEYDVIIVGAGAAGLSAAHVLDWYGWNYRVLEANPYRIGGRVMDSNPNPKFGINLDLGASFLHTTADVGNGKYSKGSDLLQEMVWHNLGSYWDQIYLRREPRKLTVLETGAKEDYHSPPEYRWAGGFSWYKFLTEEVAYSDVRRRVERGCAVDMIDTSAGPVTVRCGSRTFTTWYVMVTVPMKQLQKGAIRFSPPLGSDYTNAFNSFNIADGFKIWLGFDKRWFPQYGTRQGDYNSYQNSLNPENFNAGNRAGYRLFWNEMYPYGDVPGWYVLGGIVYGDKARQYAGDSPETIKNKILSLLQPYMGDANFNGRWELMNWSTEGYIESAYTIYANEWYQDFLLQPYPARGSWPKLVFAGEALMRGSNSWGTVHGAAKTGRDQAQKLINLGRRRRLQEEEE